MSQMILCTLGCRYDHTAWIYVYAGGSAGGMLRTQVSHKDEPKAPHPTQWEGKSASMTMFHICFIPFFIRIML